MTFRIQWQRQRINLVGLASGWRWCPGSMKDYGHDAKLETPNSIFTFEVVEQYDEGPQWPDSDKFECIRACFSPVSMELDAAKVTIALARTATERLEYQRQGKFWGCCQVGHVCAKCSTNSSKPLSLLASEEVDSGKGQARD